MKQMESRVCKLENRPQNKPGPGVIFIAGVDPVTMAETVNTAIIVNGENLHRLPDETEREFRNRVAEAGGTAQVTLPEKEVLE